MASAMALLAGMLFLPPARAQSEEGTLTFEKRVAAFEAVECVFHEARRAYALSQGATSFPAFEDAVPASAIIEKASDSVRMRKALEAFYGVQTTDDVLAGEVVAMGEGTQAPELLVAAYEALGEDAWLLADTLAQLRFAEGELRSRFAFDAGIHADRRAFAEDLRLSAVRGKGKAVTMQAAGGDLYSCEVIRLAVAEEHAGADYFSDGCRVLYLGANEFESRMAGLPAERTLSPVMETEEYFYFDYVPYKALHAAKRERIAVPKISFSEWWEGARAAFTDNPDLPPIGGVRPPGFRLPPPPPCQRRWEEMPVFNWPNSYEGHSITWTGAEIIIWGGRDRATNNPLNTGGVYSPAGITWRAMSTLGAPSPRVGHVAVWIPGKGLAVWGGSDANGTRNDGAIYDPATDTWTPISGVNAPSARMNHAAASLHPAVMGFVVWGGSSNGSHTAVLNTGGFYDAATGTWAATCSDPLICPFLPTARHHHTVTRVPGAEGDIIIVVWGGRNGSTYPTDGGRLTVSTNTWKSMSQDGQPAPVEHHSAIFIPPTGEERLVLFWGGAQGLTETNGGGFYDAALDVWTMQTPLENAPQARKEHVAAFAEFPSRRMVVWGGGDGCGRGCGFAFIPFRSGASYHLPTDTFPQGFWTEAPLEQAPVEEKNQRGAWVGGTTMVAPAGLFIWPATFGETTTSASCAASQPLSCPASTPCDALDPCGAPYQYNLFTRTCDCPPPTTCDTSNSACIYRGGARFRPWGQCCPSSRRLKTGDGAGASPPLFPFIRLRISEKDLP